MYIYIYIYIFKPAALVSLRPPNSDSDSNNFLSLGGRVSITFPNIQ